MVGVLGMKWYMAESTFLSREVVFVRSGFRSSGKLSTKKQGMKFLWRKNLDGEIIGLAW
jgi:hypothetical protein